MSDMREAGSGHRGLAALFLSDPQKPLKNHQDELFSDFPPFRAATDNMELWPSLLSNSAEGATRIVLMTHISLVTLYEFANPATRTTATFDDLIENAQKDWGAFQALRQLALADSRRSGAPNAALRTWMDSFVADEICKPSKKEGPRPHMAARGIFLATLIAHAERNGFLPHPNPGAKQEPKPIGFKLVQEALRKENWQDVPTVQTLQGVWGEFQDFVERSLGQKEKRSLSKFGVHPESMLAMMARYPAEKFK